MLGKKYFSDNDFTIEFWFYPQISSNDEIALVGDSLQNVGVFYQNGKIAFKLNSEVHYYTLPSSNKVFHIVAVYSVENASIYVDGILVKHAVLENFEFGNLELNLKTGPTLSQSDSFLINNVAIYRYALTQSQIQYHFYQGQPLPAIQIVEPAGGELFELYDDELSSVYKFSYPESQGWEQIVTTGLNNNQILNCLEMIETPSPSPSTVTIQEYISIPTSSIFDSSKIEWDGDNGITVQVSTDGGSYVNCINGQQIPGYTLNSFSNTGNLFLRIIFTSPDTSSFIPRLFNLSLTFYSDQTKYSYNGTSYIKSLEGTVGVSDLRMAMGRLPYGILSRNTRNGLKVVSGSGFKLTTSRSVGSLEFFYTPEQLTASGLISIPAITDYPAANFSWNSSGIVSKTNISAIYVNGVNKSSETNISNIFKQNQLSHVVIVFSSPISGNITFNYSGLGSVSALYQYIALYETQFNSAQAVSNYDLYIRKQSSSITDSSGLGLTEAGVEGYNNDWVVIQNV